jgi:hypothetical protein
MTEYLFLVRGGDAMKADMSPEQMEKTMGKWIAWIQQLEKAGSFKAGEPLKPEGKVIRGKKQVLTDGPYAESKDLVGGFLIIEASSLAKATEIAKQCPIYEVDGSLEVREIGRLHR